MKKKIIVISSVILLILFFVSGVYIYKNQQVKKIGFMARENAALFVREHSQTLGSDDARVYLVEFLDPACEACSAFYPFVKQMMAANPEKIKLVVRYAPFHKGADYIVRILEAARKQGKYWETLEIMYKTQSVWANHSNPQPQLIWKLLSRPWLDLEKIKNDMDDPEIVALINQDLADAKTLNVKKTPSFFVNGTPLSNFGKVQLQELVASTIEENY